MNFTLEITVESIEENLLLLNVLDRAAENGELEFKFTARPSPESFHELTDDAVIRC